MTKYFKDSDLAKQFGVSRATIWRWVKCNKFPQPVKLSTCCTRWKQADVEVWQEAQEEDQA